MLEDKRRYTEIFERDFAQRLDFFRDAIVVVKIDEAKTRELLV